MRIRINVNSLKNAMGTVFLLAAAFFVCSTFISMRSVFADPIAPANEVVQTTGRVSPRANANTRANVARTTVSRGITSRATTSRATTSRATTTKTRGTTSRATTSRATTSRATTPSRATRSATRKVTSRSGTANRTTANNRSVRARSATTQSRVSAAGSVMAGSRASVSTNYSYLSSKLYTGSYANIIDSSTGLIAADAYSNCMESYYTCMDEICTARSDTKGRCACAGRVNNFLDAEEQLEIANEELIKLSGQLSLLISTKGKGKDLATAFSLTEAEQVMNCVSWKETADKYGANSPEAINWCKVHNIYDGTGNDVTVCSMPSYCNSNSYGFKLDNLNDIKGSSSDILAQLKAWADAKDLASQYTENDVENLANAYTNISSIVNKISTTETTTTTSIDSLANKWGYKLFEYAHNNVCGRVLDSCFNGIYEACGTPPTVKDSDGKTHKKCANGSTSNCPFNYNSYIKVTTDESELGDVVLNERGSGSATAESSASCFGYTTTTTTMTGTRTAVNNASDPYYTLRGPVADARRSIMQKYLLDANSACDVYGEQLKKTAQNINYQKIAAEQALQAKRLEFKQQADSKALSEATTAINNFNECISEIWDCYTEYAEDEDNTWTTARIKAYCSQVSQVPHCYETMICSPLQSQLTAVIDLPDDDKCTFSTDYTKNTCRNVVTISEILYGTGATAAQLQLNGQKEVPNVNSAEIREWCLKQTVEPSECDNSIGNCLRGWKKKITNNGNNGGQQSGDSGGDTDNTNTTTTYTVRYMGVYDDNTGEDFEIEYAGQSEYNSSDQETTFTLEVSAPTRTNYNFTGWCLNDNTEGCGSSVKIPARTTGNIVLKAHYECSVLIDTDANTCITNQQCTNSGKKIDNADKTCVTNAQCFAKNKKISGNECTSATCSGSLPYLNVNECVATCPVYSEGNKCVSSCSGSNKIDINTCVATCPAARPYVDGNRCVAECDATSNKHIESEGSHTCITGSCPVDLDQTTNTCVTTCADGRYMDMSDNTCKAVSQCSGYVDDTSHVCVPTCDWFAQNGQTTRYESGDGRHCTTSCSSNPYDDEAEYPLQYVSEDGKSCVAECGSGKYLDGDTCVSSCPIDKQNIEDGVCVAECSSSKPYLNENTCVSSCPTGKQNIENGVCVASCSSSNPYLNGNTCVSNCSVIGKPYVENGKCTVVCSSSNPYLDGRNCVKHCSTQYIENDRCVSSCSSSKPYVNVDDNDNNICVNLSTCSSNGKYAYSAGIVNIGGNVINQSGDINNGRCLTESQCRNMGYFLYTGQPYKRCVSQQSCNISGYQIYQATGRCSSCTSEGNLILYNDQSTCVTRGSCLAMDGLVGTGSFNNNCVDRQFCIDQTNLVPSGEQCLVCSNSALFAADGSCVIECPNNLPYTSYTKECLASCPANNTEFFGYCHPSTTSCPSGAVMISGSCYMDASSAVLNLGWLSEDGTYSTATEIFDIPVSDNPIDSSRGYGEWGSKFQAGYVKGKSKCGVAPSTIAQNGLYSTVPTSTGGGTSMGGGGTGSGLSEVNLTTCYCSATGVKPTNSSRYADVTQSGWYSLGQTSTNSTICKTQCAKRCAENSRTFLEYFDVMKHQTL